MLGVGFFFFVIRQHLTSYLISCAICLSNGNFVENLVENFEVLNELSQGLEKDVHYQ